MGGIMDRDFKLFIYLFWWGKGWEEERYFSAVVCGVLAI
jgi:hypothetical protein